MKISRLKKRADFLNARKGARSHERAFVLQLIRREGIDDELLRVGFTVTKKTGNAVVRNRIKRRLREAIREAKIPKHVAGHDAVLIAKADAETLPFQQLVESIGRAFDKSRNSAGKCRNSS